jgi:hypothetical protein
LVPFSAEALPGSHVLVEGVFSQQAEECVLLSRKSAGLDLVCLEQIAVGVD